MYMVKATVRVTNHGPKKVNYKPIMASGVVRASRPAEAARMTVLNIASCMTEKGIKSESLTVKVRKVELCNDFVFWDKLPPEWN